MLSNNDNVMCIKKGRVVLCKYYRYELAGIEVDLSQWWEAGELPPHPDEMGNY